MGCRGAVFGTVHSIAVAPVMAYSSSIVFRYHEDGVFYPAEIVRGVGNGRFEHHDKDHLWLHFGALKSTAGGLYPSLSTKMKNRRLLLQTCDRLEGLIIYI